MGSGCKELRPKAAEAMTTEAVTVSFRNTSTGEPSRGGSHPPTSYRRTLSWARTGPYSKYGPAGIRSRDSDHVR